jgi:hypothetical protein
LKKQTKKSGKTAQTFCPLTLKRCFPTFGPIQQADSSGLGWFLNASEKEKENANPHGTPSSPPRQYRALFSKKKFATLGLKTLLICA